MSKFLVVDLETLGNWNDAVILSLGMVYNYYDKSKALSFQEMIDTGLYIEFDVKEQVAMGRTMDQKTIDWWKQQSGPAKDVFLNKIPKVSINKIDEAVQNWVKEYDVGDLRKMDIYDRKHFDITKLQHIYETHLNKDYFWEPRTMYEVGTMLKFTGDGSRYGGIKPEDIPGMIYHNPVHDSALDGVRIIKNLTELGAI